ncbi:MAG: EamA family transporter, partial [Rhodocyclaceae bacterium]
MGEWVALLSACCFAAANVTIMLGAGAERQDNGVFLSILLTTGIAGAIWLVQGMQQGWPVINLNAVLWFAGAGILTIFIGRVFHYASVQHLGAMRASAVKRLNPLFSVLLGVLLLGEAFDLTMLVGMLLIGAGFGILIRQALSTRGLPRADGSAAVAASWGASLHKLGFFYGPVSALAYAVGYVARKQGLNLMPDAAFGTMLGSVVGAVMFVLMAQFVAGYRLALRSTFTTFNPWLPASGVLSSAGQLFYFVALSHSSISRVAVISSLEAFATIVLTVLITRSFKQLTPAVLLAAGLGVAGT